MFRIMEDGSLLNIIWVDTFEVVDNTIVYVLANGTTKREVFASHEDAVEASKEIGKPPEVYEDVNDIEF